MKTALNFTILLCGLASAAEATDVTLDGEGYIYMEQPEFLTQVPVPDYTAVPASKSRFLWDAPKRALRFGDSNINIPYLGWTENNIGSHSFSAGRNTAALGNYSFSFGSLAIAHETGSIAIGRTAIAGGLDAVAIGYYTTATGQSSYALGSGATTEQYASYSYAIGNNALISEDNHHGYAIGRNATVSSTEDGFAIGNNTYTGNANAMALGDSAGASGYGSVALRGTTINGATRSIAISGGTTQAPYSAALGEYALANGEYAFAFGTSTTARSPFSFVIGRYNKNTKKDEITVPNNLANAITNDDPVFEVGVGTNSADRRNAMTVFRDGTARFEGPVEVKGASGKVVLDAGAVIGTRTVQLPDNDGALLSTSSQLDATLLTGEVPAANLPAVTQLIGDLPWSRVSGTPTSVESYGITNTIPVEREMIGGVEVIASAIRIKPQGDIPMFGAP